MRCTTYARYEWDGTQYVEVETEAYDHAGPWSLCKESSAEKQRRQRMEDLQFTGAQDYYTKDVPFQRDMAQKQFDAYQRQAAQQEQYQQQALAMQKSQFDQYSQMMKDALAKQYAATDPVVASMTPYLSGNVGFDDTTLRTMTDQGLSQVFGGYDDANAALKSRMLAMGGGMPMSGSDVRGMAELEGGLANSVAGTRNNIALENARQMLLNKFNAGGVIMGAGAQYQGNVGTGVQGTQSASGQFGAGSNTFAQAPITSIPGAPAMLASQYYPKPQGFWGGFGQKMLGLGAEAGLTALTGGANAALAGKGFMSGFRF